MVWVAYQLLPISSLSQFHISFRQNSANMILFIFIFVFKVFSISSGVNITEQSASNVDLFFARKAPAPGQWQHYQVRFGEKANAKIPNCSVKLFGLS